MPLNKIINYFRHQKQQNNNNKNKKQNNYKNNILKNNNNYLINNNSTTKNINNNLVVGCCSSRKTSSLPSNNYLAQKQKCWIGRKNSDELKHSSSSEQQKLFSDILLCKIFDSIDNPFELIRLRRVCKKAEEYVKNRISNVTELDICRVKFENLSSSSSTSFSSNTCLIEGELFNLHPSGCKILGKITNLNLNEEDKNIKKLKLQVYVDDQWTSKEITILYFLINEFRINLKRISLDSPIFELIVAKLAFVDLDRWFAYQCFVKAIDECQMNAALNKLAAQLQQQQEDVYDKTDNLYWPNAKTILIRTTESESIHLARILNYGVRSNLVMDKRQLNCFSLQICVKDENKVTIAQRPKQLIKNLYHFRCWAGSPGFDERFSQQWKAINSRAA